MHLPLSAIASGIVAGGDAVLALHALIYNPTTYEMLGVKTGTGDLTTTHASGNIVRDFEDIWRTVAANEAVWSGARIVRNTVTQSDDITLQSAGFRTATADSATQATFDAGEAYLSVSSVTVNNGDKIIYRARLLGGTMGDVGLKCTRGAQTAITVNTSTDAGKIFTIAITATSTGTVVFGFDGRSGHGGDGVSAGTVQWDNSQIEIVSGQADTTTPSEYIATTTAAVTKAYANQNGNSVASNVVTEAAGSALATVPRLRYLPAATNIRPYSNDQTYLSWIKASSPIVAQDAIGLKSIPNTACTLTSTVIGSVVYAIVGIAADTDDNSVVYYIEKDINASSTCRLIFSNVGSNAEIITFDITDGSVVELVSINGNYEVIDDGNWWKVILTVLGDGADINGTIGIYPDDTTGTAYCTIGNIEFYPGKSTVEVRGLSPIYTVASAVNTNTTLSEFDDANYSATNGGLYLEWTPSFSTSETSGDHQILSLNNAAGLLYYDATNSLLKSYDGTNTASVALTVTKNTPVKIAVAYDASNLNVCAATTWGISQNYDGTHTTGTEIDVFLGEAFAQDAEDLRGFTGSYTDVKFEIDTLMAA